MINQELTGLFDTLWKRESGHRERSESGEVSGGYGTLRGSINSYQFSEEKSEHLPLAQAMVSCIETKLGFQLRNQKVYCIITKRAGGSG